jgi:hypothetical protein
LGKSEGKQVFQKVEQKHFWYGASVQIGAPALKRPVSKGTNSKFWIAQQRFANKLLLLGPWKQVGRRGVLASP